MATAQEKRREAAKKKDTQRDREREGEREKARREGPWEGSEGKNFITCSNHGGLQGKSQRQERAKRRDDDEKERAPTCVDTQAGSFLKKHIVLHGVRVCGGGQKDMAWPAGERR